MSSSRAAFVVMTALLLAFASAGSAQLTVTLGGDHSTIYYSVTSVTPPDTSYCVTGIVIDGLEGDAVGNGPPCAVTPALQGYVVCKTLGPHTVSANAYNASGQMFQVAPPQTVFVSAVPSTCTNLIGGHLNFDITERAAASDREVLLSNTHLGPAGVPDTPYPHYQAFLAKDKQIPVDLRIIYNGAQTSGVTVTMSVVDPPDPSPYVAGGSGVGQPVPGVQLSHPGDNLGGAAKLMGPDVTDNGNGTYTVTSGANGSIETILQLDATARAGDNYQVVATATFPDGSVVTSNSGVITAWKRVFVDKEPMFRRGVPLACDAPAGVTHVTVSSDPISSRSGRKQDHFASGDTILLLHAPQYGQPKSPGAYYSNTYSIGAKPTSFTVKTPWPVPGTGTVQTFGTASIVGSGTHFNSGVKVDDVLNLTLPSGIVESHVITAVIDNTHLTVNAPTSLAASGLIFSVGDTSLLIGTTYVRLTLDRPLAESYFRESAARPDLLTLNDAVARLSANVSPPSAADTLNVQDLSAVLGNADNQWGNPFQSAYTEYTLLPAQGTPLPHAYLDANAVAQRFADKWFVSPVPVSVPSTSADHFNWYQYPAVPNQQLLLIADSDTTDAAASTQDGFLTNAVPGERLSVLDRGTVETTVTLSGSSLNGANPEVVLRRTAAHEMTHQWWANAPVFGSTYSDHCNGEVAYDSQAAYPQQDGTPPAGLKFCLMSYTDLGPQMPAPWDSIIKINMIQYYYRFGFTSYHMAQLPGSGAWESEYLEIRKRADPWLP